MRARRRPSFLASLDHSTREPLEALAGREVGLIAGVARPASVRRTLESLGARVVVERLFPDHHAYRREDLACLGEQVGEWVTTEKDAFKILPRWLAETKLSVLGIELELEDAEAVFDQLEAHLAERLPGGFRSVGSPRASISQSLSASLDPFDRLRSAPAGGGPARRRARASVRSRKATR